jgi:CPA1 family monovalent cation:H+ antiporter
MVFLTLGLSSLAVFWARRFRLPHTVFLVLIGILLGLLSFIPEFHFIREFTLTPELLFFILLPTLIFESAYNISARRLTEDFPMVMVLAVVSLLVSTVIVATALFFVLEWIGLGVPFIIALLFGALISATDPVAVLALFKEYGAPRRLSLIFEGESLFNDATAVALFLILLEVAVTGYEGFPTLSAGIVAFTTMIVGGIVYGAVVGWGFSYLVGKTRENEVASITLTLVLAHITFITAEMLSHHLHIGGYETPLSPIIATTIAALVMGNYGRAKIHPKAEPFVETLWGQFAFMANSIIFILIGVVFATIPGSADGLLVATLAAVVIVAIARAFSIYPVVGLANVFSHTERKLPLSWQHLLAWGSLRGALAITMVLLIPADFTVPGWNLEMSPRDFLLALTAGCIFATLFLKATSIGALMRRLKLDALTPIEEVEYQEARALLHHEVAERLARYQERGYIDGPIAEKLIAVHTNAYQAACTSVATQGGEAAAALTLRVLRMYAIGIEQLHLSDLYHHHEVNESVFRRLSGKLRLQLEAVEHGNLAPNESVHTDEKDVFERCFDWITSHFVRDTHDSNVANRYMYYRAQTILSRKVLKELSSLTGEDARNIFTPTALAHVTDVYERFMRQSDKKMRELAAAHGEVINPLSEELARCGVQKVTHDVLEHIREQSLITPKLAVRLADDLRQT